MAKAKQATARTPASAPLGDRPGFDEILDPVSPEEFFATYWDREPLHIRGGADKFARLMSWETLTDLLNMTSVWSGATLQLVLDRNIIPPAQYCRTARGRDGRDVLQPDAEQVMALLRSGASMVANDIDALTPALAGFAGALEDALDARVQGNLYCSWRERQGFDSHFDTHDVFAVHVAGEKLWRLYETRMDNPIAHPRFKSFGQAWHDSNKGEVALEVVMQPGDLLYIPRGRYHDALATSDGTIHVAFGATYVIGMDVIDLLANLAVEDPAFRRNMPRRTEGEQAAADWLAGLGERLARLARDPESVQAMRQHQAHFRYPRGGISLPVERPGRQFRITAPDLAVRRSEGRWVLAGRKGAAPIPDGMEEPVRWVIARPAFCEADLAAAFPAMDGAVRDELLAALARMKVIGAVSG